MVTRITETQSCDACPGDGYQYLNNTGTPCDQKWRDELNCAVSYHQQLTKSDIDPPILDIDKIRSNGFIGIETPVRPIVWRLLLGGLSPDTSEWCASLFEKRKQYRALKLVFQSCQHNRPDQETDQREVLPENFCTCETDVSLLKEIEKDVARTQRDLPFFALGGNAHRWMISILFVYAKQNPELGYVQGMNEILAPIVYTYGSDQANEWAKETEADAFDSFSAVMASAKVLYKRLPNDSIKTGVVTQMARLNMLLRQHDALLWQHLNSIGLSPDLYCLRWYMTLLAREFSIETTQRIWDALLSDTKRFSFLHYICCALIRSQRMKLLHKGFTEALKILQTLAVLNIDAILDQALDMRNKDRQIDQTRAASELQISV